VKYEKSVMITGVQRFDEAVVEVERRQISNVQNMMHHEPEPTGVNLITWAYVYHDRVKLKVHQY